jgi:hypothetical protein
MPDVAEFLSRARRIQGRCHRMHFLKRRDFLGLLIHKQREVFLFQIADVHAAFVHNDGNHHQIR